MSKADGERVINKIVKSIDELLPKEGDPGDIWVINIEGETREEIEDKLVGGLIKVLSPGEAVIHAARIFKILGSAEVHKEILEEYGDRIKKDGAVPMVTIGLPRKSLKNAAAVIVRVPALVVLSDYKPVETAGSEPAPKDQEEEESDQVYEVSGSYYPNIYSKTVGIIPTRKTDKTKYFKRVKIDNETFDKFHAIYGKYRYTLSLPAGKDSVPVPNVTNKIFPKLPAICQRALLFTLRAGMKNQTFIKELPELDGRQVGYNVPVDVWEWCKIEGYKDRKSARKRFIESMRMIQYLVLYIPVKGSSQPASKGLINSVDPHNDRSGIVDIGFSPYISEEIHKLVSKNVLSYIQDGKRSLSCKEYPLSTPILCYLAGLVGFNLGDKTGKIKGAKRERIRYISIPSLLKNLERSLKPYDERSKKTNWKQEIIKPILKTLYALVGNDQMLGYRIIRWGKEGILEAPERWEDFHRPDVKLEFYLPEEKKEGGEIKRIEKIDFAEWEGVGVCSCGVRPLPIENGKD